MWKAILSLLGGASPSKQSQDANMSTSGDLSSLMGQLGGGGSPAMGGVEGQQMPGVNPQMIQQLMAMFGKKKPTDPSLPGMGQQSPANQGFDTNGIDFSRWS